MKIPASSVLRQRGLTLIELMVALTISLLLLTGTASLFISNKRIYREQEEMGRLQENARFAIDLFIRELRMAAYSGCAHTNVTVNNWLDVDDAGTVTFLPDRLIEGADAEEDDTPAISWLPSGSVDQIANMVPGTDAITVRYLSPSSRKLDEAMVSNDAPFKVESPSGIREFDIIALADCANVDIMQVTAVDTESEPGVVDIVSHETGGTSPGNTDQNLSTKFGTDAEVMRFAFRRFFIGNGANGPGLFMTDMNGELVEGVENMQIRYGDGNNFVRATEVADWEHVTGVRIALLMRTVEEGQHNEIDTKTYNLLGTTVNPVDDRRRRKVFAVTIRIRNRA